MRKTVQKTKIEESDWLLVDLCVGCGKRPINIGNMGRFKLACPIAVAHSKEATKKCDEGITRPMWTWWDQARNDWNRRQDELIEKEW